MLNINNKEKKSYLLFLFLSIILLFFITRLTHLTILPIFNDEAVYIRWAKMINEDIHNIWLPIQVDNKKPLLMWLISVALNIFQDPLWAARFISVAAGFFSLIGIYLIGYQLHSVWVGCLSALFYTFTPWKLLLPSYLFGLLIASFPYGVLFLTSSNYSVKNILIPITHSKGQSNIAEILSEIPKNIYSSIGGVIDYFVTYLTVPILFFNSAFFLTWYCWTWFFKILSVLRNTYSALGCIDIASCCRFS